VPSFRKEPPPSAKTSRRGGASCAPAQEELKNRNKIHGAMIRMVRIAILSNADAPFDGDHDSGGVQC
jgi:hypothetical protein